MKAANLQDTKSNGDSPFTTQESFSASFGYMHIDSFFMHSLFISIWGILYSAVFVAIVLPAIQPFCSNISTLFDFVGFFAFTIPFLLFLSLYAAIISGKQIFTFDSNGITIQFQKWFFASRVPVKTVHLTFKEIKCPKMYIEKLVQCGFFMVKPDPTKEDRYCFTFEDHVKKQFHLCRLFSSKKELNGAPCSLDESIKFIENLFKTHKSEPLIIDRDRE